MKTVASTREAFTAAMMELAKEDPAFVLVCADSVKALRATPFQDAYPERLFDVGIAEQNSVAFAAGLASCGLVPFVGTYAGFLTMRACEQMRTFVAYPGLNVKFVGINGGLFGGEREGVTHQFFEDLGIVRSIPGFTVVVPADASQVVKATKAIAACKGPAYLRLGSGREHVVFDDKMTFELGKARILKEYGKDTAIFTNGFIIPRVLKAAEILKDQGINVTVVEVHTLKPLDTDFIIDILKQTGAAISVEDHNIIGGLGSAIAEVSTENFPAPLARVGLKDIYPISGEAEALLDFFEMGVGNIIDAVKKVMEQKKKLSR